MLVTMGSFLLCRKIQVRRILKENCYKLFSFKEFFKIYIAAKAAYVMSGEISQPQIQNT